MAPLLMTLNDLEGQSLRPFEAFLHPVYWAEVDRTALLKYKYFTIYSEMFIIINNNNPFNVLLCRMIWVSRYQRNIHFLTPCLCGYCTTFLFDFLHFLQSIASSLHICIL